MKRLHLLALPVLLLLQVSCGGGSSTPSTGPTPRVLVLVLPSNVSINVVTSQKFQAALGGNSNLIVTWQVNDITGGDATVGTIDSTGLYLAPGTVPSPDTVTIKAISSEDENSFGTATVKILPPPTVAVTPSSATVVSGAQTTFTATVTGAPTTNVDWTVNGGTSGIFGNINAGGVYTAPPSPPPGGMVTVKATSRDYPLASATATVTVTDFATASFQGPYAFSMSGTNASGAFVRAGMFVADGAGKLTGGVENIAEASGATVPSVVFSGSYTVGADGRGTMHFDDGRTPGTFRIVLANHNQVQIIGFDGSGTATGQADLQSQEAFNLWDLNSTHAFDFTGANSAAAPVSVVGRFTANGAGAITAGVADINDNGVVTSQAAFAGSYTVNVQAGSGTATWQLPGGDQHFNFYIVSSGQAKFVRTDPPTTAGILAGVASQQAPNVTFSQSTLNGHYAFLVSGAGPSGMIATAGMFTAGGTGQITAGVLDENVNGTVTQNIAVTSGTYVLAANGRGTATFITPGKTYEFVFHMGPSGTAVLQETDSSITSDGQFAQQQTAAISQATLQGSYALRTGGLVAAAAEKVLGRLTADGAGAISAGAIDVNTGGSLITGEAATGTYMLGANGRGTLALNSTTDNRSFVLYAVDSNRVFLIGVDAGRITSGRLAKRF